jgi:hypothetical protein
VGGRRVLPWNPYASCGTSTPTTLPKTVRIELYEEFPDPWRLRQLRQVDFPVTLAIAAPSRATFLERSAAIMRDYPKVREVYFWPLLTEAEGYYPGTWSNAAATVQPGLRGQAVAVSALRVWRFCRRQTHIPPGFAGDCLGQGNRFENDISQRMNAALCINS